MSNIDLHIHSECSDGSENVHDIVKLASDLKQFSICDHDTFLAYNLFDMPENCICGIEVSTYDSSLKRNVHILGYSPTNKKLIENFCLPTLKMMEQVSFKQVKKLSSFGYPISWDEVKEKAKNSASVYKQHILSVLIEKKVTDKIYGSFYKKNFKNGGICDIEKVFPNTKEAIEVLRQAGAITILAHPQLSKIDNDLDIFKEYGINGIEVFHSSTSLKSSFEMEEYCKKNDLIITGGSDYHGSYGNEPFIGSFYWKGNQILCK